jgi:hypothetical protein
LLSAVISGYSRQLRRSTIGNSALRAAVLLLSGTRKLTDK